MSKFLPFLGKKSSSAKKSVAIADRRLIHPGRDWLIGLGLFVVIVIAGGTVSGILFVRYSSVDVGASETPAILPRYNQPLIVDATALYEERQQVFRTFSGKAEPVIVAPIATTTPEVATSTSEVDLSNGESIPTPVEVPTTITETQVELGN